MKKKQKQNNKWLKTREYLLSNEHIRTKSLPAFWVPYLYPWKAHSLSLSLFNSLTIVVLLNSSSES